MMMTERKSKPETKEVKNKRKGKRPAAKSEEDSTIISEDDRDKKGKRKSSRYYRDRDYERHYQNDTFLDVLIDTLCTGPNAVCKTKLDDDDDYYLDEDETFASQDDSTYITYDSSEKPRDRRRRDESSFDETTEDDTLTTEDERRHRKLQKKKLLAAKESTETKKNNRYEDNETLITMETGDRPKQPPPATSTLLGLAPDAVKPKAMSPPPAVEPEPTLPQSDEDDGNPAPIKEVAYDDDESSQSNTICTCKMNTDTLASPSDYSNRL
jgi:hypothetical protein